MKNYSDLFIIGGGINGTAIAADAAGRKLSVTLCEKHDLASGTSSASTKLIHGGLRYLESYEFGLVRKALYEREVLLKRAPFLIKPLQFILPHEKHLRPAWLIRLGLFFYDHLAKHPSLPGSTALSLQNTRYGQPLLPFLTRGFSYYDCQTDDARLVILNALSAKNHQANILTRSEFIQAQREKDYWKIELKNISTQHTQFHYAKALINAAGPWINTVKLTQFNMKLVKGSHIVVPKLYEGEFAYILQCEDQRIVFAIPYQTHFTLIGTTDVLLSYPVETPAITQQESQYLLDIIHHYFRKKITLDEIKWTYAGIRCLQDETKETPANTTRDYKLILETHNNQLPLVTVIGGKITTHRLLAEEALKQLQPFFPHMGASWTAKQPLPGANFSLLAFQARFSWLPSSLITRYANQYGALAYLLLENANCLVDMGKHFSHGLYEKEIVYLIHHEWAKTVEDILWRRTKLGLLFKDTEVTQVKEYMNQYIALPTHNLLSPNL